MVGSKTRLSSAIKHLLWEVLFNRDREVTPTLMNLKPMAASTSIMKKTKCGKNTYWICFILSDIYLL